MKQPSDWISNAVSCSAQLIFDKLAQAMKKDTVDANAHNIATPGYGHISYTFFPDVREVQILRNDARSFEGPTIRDKVQVYLRDNGVEVFLRGDFAFRVVPRIVSDECRMQVEGEILPAWEISRKALRELFFPSAIIKA